jgi:transcriptional antiterminator RfaH
MRGQSEQIFVQIRDQTNRWLVVRTKPRREKIALSHLRQRELPVYCPMFLRPPWHLRAPRGPIPLFTGYLFVRCEPELRVNAVRFCPGVLNIVNFAGVIATVEDDFIEAIRLREGDRGYVLPLEAEKGIPNGASVRVMAGPLEGIKGVFQGYLRGKERAKILMDFLRNRHEVELDASALAVVRA